MNDTRMNIKNALIDVMETALDDAEERCDIVVGNDNVARATIVIGGEFYVLSLHATTFGEIVDAATRGENA